MSIMRSMASSGEGGGSGAASTVGSCTVSRSSLRRSRSMRSRVVSLVCESGRALSRRLPFTGAARGGG